MSGQWLRDTIARIRELYWKPRSETLPIAMRAERDAFIHGVAPRLADECERLQGEVLAITQGKLIAIERVAELERERDAARGHPSDQAELELIGRILRHTGSMHGRGGLADAVANFKGVRLAGKYKSERDQARREAAALSLRVQEFEPRLAQCESTLLERIAVLEGHPDGRDHVMVIGWSKETDVDEMPTYLEVVRQGAHMHEGRGGRVTASYFPAKRCLDAEARAAELDVHAEHVEHCAELAMSGRYRRQDVGWPAPPPSFALHAFAVSLNAIMTLAKRVDELQSAKPTWIVNDIGELGVEIHDRRFFLYKGDSIEYDGLHDDGTKMAYRPVYKREFGETCHPRDWWLLCEGCQKASSRYPGRYDYFHSDAGWWKPLTKNRAQPEPPSDAPKWCARLPSDEEHAYMFGPFSCKDLAIEAAAVRRIEMGRSDTEVIVGHCVFADAGEHGGFFGSDVELMLENIEEYTAENEFCWVEDSIFEYRDGSDSSTLAADICTALSRHMHSRYWMMDEDDQETVGLLIESGEGKP